jgi:LPXTG-motif cell wall-anchored protein
MRTIRGEYLIAIGFVMVLVGAILPFLMVMHTVKSTLFLDFFSYTISIAGLFLGIIGSAFLVTYRRRKNSDTPPPMDVPPDNHHDW